MEGVEYLFLKVVLEVNQQVAAADQVRAQEGRVLKNILTSKDDGFAERLDDFVGDALRMEVAVDQFRRHGAQARLGIQAAPGVGHGGKVQVGGEDLDLAFVSFVAEQFEKHDGDCVGLFARRASGDPDADFIAGGFAFQQFSQRFLERIEGERVPEEGGDRYQDFLAELVVFLGVSLGENQVFIHVMHPIGGHSAQDAPPDGCLLVAGEIDLGVALYLVEQRFQGR